MSISHVIYVYVNPQLNEINKLLLSYIQKNKNNIKLLDVNLKVYSLDKEHEINELIEKYNITMFPVLLTPKKVYNGIKEIINIYDINIKKYNEILEYNNMLEQKLMNERKNKENKSLYIQNDPDNFLHSYTNQELKGFSKNLDDEGDDLGDTINNNVLDAYRQMMQTRNIKKGNDQPSMSSNMSVNSLDSINPIKPIQLSDRKDNIISEEPKSINIDVNQIEKDGTEDPQDDIIERAYWSRIAETN